MTQNNARLIAAAPEMLDTLRDGLQAFLYGETMEDGGAVFFARVRALLARIERGE